MKPQSLFLQIHPNDSVAVALRPLKKGSILKTAAGPCTLEEDIPQGHKFALQGIPSGSDVIKYGSPIGHAVCPIRKGAWVHTHNVRTNLDGELSYSYRKKNPPASRSAGALLLRLPPQGRQGRRPQ